MPNKKGWRKPNRTWSEDTAERREQKRQAAARFRELHQRDPLWKEKQADAKRRSRAGSDPNREREHAQERRFRFTATLDSRYEMLDLFMTPQHFLRPQFTWQPPRGLRTIEVWETAEELEARLKKRGPTMTKKRLEIPPEIARRVLEEYFTPESQREEVEVIALFGSIPVRYKLSRTEAEIEIRESEDRHASWVRLMREWIAQLEQEGESASPDRVGTILAQAQEARQCLAYEIASDTAWRERGDILDRSEWQATREGPDAASGPANHEPN